MNRSAAPEGRGREALQRALRLVGISIQFGIPAYNEGRGIVHTLESLFQASEWLQVGQMDVILSDSSQSSETVEAAEAWARGREVRLHIDRSERRRSQKEAVNTILSRAQADILILVDADVVVPTEGMAHLLLDLTDTPRPVAAFGAALPDPAYTGWRYRPAVWQMKATHRFNSRLPAQAVRTEGSFWGAWRSFYTNYRFPLGVGSVHNDVELARYLRTNRLPVRNSWRAICYKVPAGSLRDFSLQTHRFYAAGGSGQHRSWNDIAVAFTQTLRDPIGAFLYLGARIRSAITWRREGLTLDEHWTIAESTKRR